MTANSLDIKDDMVAYEAPMLPDVDYQIFKDDTLCDLLGCLEAGIKDNCCDFLEALKIALIEERLVQTPELLVAPLCAYFGVTFALYTLHEAKVLEPKAMALIQHQAMAAYQQFRRYPINDKEKGQDKKQNNLDALRKKTPGSILVQTMRLGQTMIDVLDVLDELVDNQPISFRRSEQKTVWCSEETLMAITMGIGSQQCAEWKVQLEGLSERYVINQLAIQIGWVIGYFSHLFNQPLIKSAYFDYGLAMMSLYREYTYKLMQTFAKVKQAEEGAKEARAEALLKEVSELTQKIQGKASFAVNDFQKSFMIARAGIEAVLTELIGEGGAIKIILMSVFYWWFQLEASFHTSFEIIDKEETFTHMLCIIDVVKETVNALPNPKLSADIMELNEKMQALKQYLPEPENFDTVSSQQLAQQTGKINVAINTLIRRTMQQKIHPEALANALFNHWLRFSVFFGVSESQWQKMDHYFAQILERVRQYMENLLNRSDEKV